jgi:hypothetical protein
MLKRAGFKIESKESFSGLICRYKCTKEED